MSDCPFCNSGSEANAGPNKRTSTLLARFCRAIQWMFPTALLVLMPKCPLCVAAYVALFTGIGISVSAARWLQVFMFVLCLGSLSYMAVRWLGGRAFRRAAARPEPRPPTIHAEGTTR